MEHWLCRIVCCELSNLFPAPPNLYLRTLKADDEVRGDAGSFDPHAVMRIETSFHSSFGFPGGLIQSVIECLARCGISYRCFPMERICIQTSASAIRPN